MEKSASEPGTVETLSVDSSNRQPAGVMARSRQVSTKAPADSSTTAVPKKPKVVSAPPVSQVPMTSGSGLIAPK